MTALALALTLVSAASAPDDALKSARTHLASGKLDEVLFALQAVGFEGDQARDAADLLAQAGRKSLDAQDPVFALQFAQMALRHAPNHELGLEIGARACLAQLQYGPAEEYANTWLQVTEGAPSARLLRAELAIQQGEWEKTLLYIDGVSPAGLSRAQKAHFKRLHATATKELEARRDARTEMKALERELRKKQELAAESPTNTRLASAQGQPKVVLYGTSWCGYCKKARAWLTSRGIRFEEKDIERDEEAAAELARKKAERGIRGGGVPVIDVGGSLVRGFDKPELERLLGGK